VPRIVPTCVCKLVPLVYSKLSPGCKSGCCRRRRPFHFLHLMLGVGDDPVAAHSCAATSPVFSIVIVYANTY
jgi:hypothetical protein